MKSPLLVLHDALLQKIKEQTKWKAFDNVPPNEPFPYVELGPISATDWSDKFEPGQQVIMTLDMWSDYEGKAEVLEMVNDVLEAVTSGDLDLSPNFRAVYDCLELNEVIVDIDGYRRHGILKFRYLIEEI